MSEEACRGGMVAGEIIVLVRESPEGGYEARALGQAIFREADDLQRLKERLRDAVRCHLDEGERPAVFRLCMVREDVIIPGAAA